MRGDKGLHLRLNGRTHDELYAEAYRNGMQFFGTEQVEVVFLDAEPHSVATNALGERTIFTFSAVFVVFDVRPDRQGFAS